MADTTRRDREIDDEETSAEAGWIARTLDDPLLDAEAAERVLQAHRRYLAFPPPDALVAPEELRAMEHDHEATGDPERELGPGLAGGSIRSADPAPERQLARRATDRGLTAGSHRLNDAPARATHPPFRRWAAAGARSRW